jgi:acetolactate synthase-1/2/3 large subunit
VARALKAEGVEAIFTLCGGHIIDIYDGCLDEGIKSIDVRHEQAAAHAADAWTRVTGKPGVAVVTAGPGTTDTVTGVANAFRAQTPMLVIGGQGASTPACQVRDSSPLLWVDKKAAGAEGLSGDDHKGERYG